MGKCRGQQRGHMVAPQWHVVGCKATHGVTRHGAMTLQSHMHDQPPAANKQEASAQQRRRLAPAAAGSEASEWPLVRLGVRCGAA